VENLSWNSSKLSDSCRISSSCLPQGLKSPVAQVRSEVNRHLQFKQEATFIDNTGAGANIKSKLHTRMSFARDFFNR
jgi:hypothetical protein